MSKYLRRSDGPGDLGGSPRRVVKALHKAGQRLAADPLGQEDGPGEAVVDLLAWHGEALVCLERGDHAGAQPRLARLVLALPQGHRARPGALTTLAHVYCEVGRFERAVVVAAEARRLDPGLQAAAAVLARARGRL